LAHNDGVTVRAFISSTYRDLREHRAYVIERLTRGGVFVDPMERWTAAADEPKELSQERVRDCDLCVLLVGFRRGHVPEGESQSITQMEYREALRREIDVLVFMADENGDWPDDAVAGLRADREMRRWRDELKEHAVVEFFQPRPESIDVDSALLRWMEKRSREGSRPAENFDTYPIETRAWSNSEAVLVAWRTPTVIPRCLGFALQRRTLGGTEDQFVNTFMPFAGQPATAGAPSPRASNVQPIQNFRWTDRPQSDQEVRYRVVPVIGRSSDELHEDFARASGWTQWLSKATGTTPGYRAAFDRARPAALAAAPSETRSTLLQLLIAAKGLDQRVFAALPEIGDPAIRAALRKLGRKLSVVAAGRSRNQFIVVCDRWGTPVRVWLGRAAWTAGRNAENSAMTIDSVPLARAYLDRWEELRDEARRHSPPVQISLHDTALTLWTHGRAAMTRDAVRLIRGARYGVLFLLDPKWKDLLSEIIQLTQGGLWVQGLSGHQYLSSDDPRTMYSRLIPSVRTNVIAIDPFGSHPVIIHIAANGEMLIIEDAPGLAAEWAVHLIAVCDSYRFRAAMLMTGDRTFGLHRTDAWQTPYFRGRLRTQFDCFFGTLPL